MFKLLIAVLILLSMFFPAETHGQEPPRVKVADGTLVSADGKVLRGTPFFVDIFGVPDMQENEAEYHNYFNSIFKEHPEINCVRIGGGWEIGNTTSGKMNSIANSICT